MKTKLFFVSFGTILMTANLFAGAESKKFPVSVTTLFDSTAYEEALQDARGALPSRPFPEFELRIVGYGVDRNRTSGGKHPLIVLERQNVAIWPSFNMPHGKIIGTLPKGSQVVTTARFEPADELPSEEKHTSRRLPSAVSELLASVHYRKAMGVARGGLPEGKQPLLVGYGLREGDRGVQHPFIALAKPNTHFAPLGEIIGESYFTADGGDNVTSAYFKPAAEPAPFGR